MNVCLSNGESDFFFFYNAKTYAYYNKVSIAFVKLFEVKVCVCWKLSYLCTPIREKVSNFL